MGSLGTGGNGPDGKETQLVPCLLPTPGRSAARRTGGWSAVIPVTEIDAPLGQVVGRHVDGEPIARQNADAILLHTA